MKSIKEYERQLFHEIDYSLRLLHEQIEENTLGGHLQVDSRERYALYAYNWLCNLKYGIATAKSQEELEKYVKAFYQALLKINLALLKKNGGSDTEDVTPITMRAIKLNQLEKQIYRFRADFSEADKKNFLENLHRDPKLKDEDLDEKLLEYKQEIAALAALQDITQIQQARQMLWEKISEETGYIPAPVMSVKAITDKLQNRIIEVQKIRNLYLHRVKSPVELAKDFVPNSFSIVLGSVGVAVAVLALAPTVGLAVALGALVVTTADLTLTHYDRLASESDAELPYSDLEPLMARIEEEAKAKAKRGLDDDSDDDSENVQASPIEEQSPEVLEKFMEQQRTKLLKVDDTVAVQEKKAEPSLAESDENTENMETGETPEKATVAKVQPRSEPGKVAEAVKPVPAGVAAGSSSEPTSTWSKVKPWVLTGVAVAGFTLGIAGILATGIPALVIATAGLALAVGVGVGMAALHGYNLYQLHKVDKSIKEMKDNFEQKETDLKVELEGPSSTEKIDVLMGDSMKTLPKLTVNLLSQQEQDRIAKEKSLTPAADEDIIVIQMQEDDMVVMPAPNIVPSPQDEDEEDEEGEGVIPEAKHPKGSSQ